MQLPGDPNSALVVDTDALPDNYNDSLRRVVESTEGQQSENLAEVLARRMSPDGSNTTLLSKFHQAGRLQKVPVNLVTMTPRKGVRWPLSEVLQAMDSIKQSTPDGFDELDPETRAALAADLKKFNVHALNMDGDSKADRKDEAMNLLRQAELLEADAQNIRQRAYKIAPSLSPTSANRKASKARGDQAYNDLPPLEATPVVASKTKSATKSVTKTAAAKSKAVPPSTSEKL